jgi:hypothetical protein
MDTELFSVRQKQIIYMQFEQALNSTDLISLDLILKEGFS